MKRMIGLINRFCVPSTTGKTAFGFTSGEESVDDRLTSHDTKEAVLGVVEKLGYSLGPEDGDAPLGLRPPVRGHGGNAGFYPPGPGISR